MATPTTPRTPCWHCRHMRSLEPRTDLVRCGLASAGGAPHRHGARLGCERWEREPGIDDDDWDPPGLQRIAPRVAEPSRPRRPPPVPKTEPVVVALLVRDPFGGLFNWQDD